MSTTDMTGLPHEALVLEGINERPPFTIGGFRRFGFWGKNKPSTVRGNLLRVHEGKIQLLLVLDRREGDNQGYWWRPPGGEVDYAAKEGPDDALLREVFEETGIRVPHEASAIFDSRVVKNHHLSKTKVFAYVILLPRGILCDPVRLREPEIIAARWFTLDQVATSERLPTKDGTLYPLDTTLNVPLLAETLQAHMGRIMEVVGLGATPLVEFATKVLSKEK